MFTTELGGVLRNSTTTLHSALLCTCQQPSCRDKAAVEAAGQPVRQHRPCHLLPTACVKHQQRRSPVRLHHGAEHHAVVFTAAARPWRKEGLPGGAPGFVPRPARGSAQ